MTLDPLERVNPWTIFIDYAVDYADDHADPIPNAYVDRILGPVPEPGSEG